MAWPKMVHQSSKEVIRMMKKKALKSCFSPIIRLQDVSSLSPVLLSPRSGRNGLHLRSKNQVVPSLRPQVEFPKTVVLSQLYCPSWQRLQSSMLSESLKTFLYFHSKWPQRTMKTHSHLPSPESERFCVPHSVYPLAHYYWSMCSI